jgi:hypothetical protein
MKSIKPDRVLKFLIACSMLAAVASAGVKAQAPFQASTTQAIPRNYDSWSLFLVCNPGWIINKGDPGIQKLFAAYKAYADAIGPRNLAIWFWKQPVKTATVEATDIGRMAAYCTKFSLTPSETPQVVTTTRYPDDSGIGDRVVTSLNGDDESSARALSVLTDQLLKTGLDQSGLDADQRWTRIVTAAEAAVSSVGCYFNKVKISVQTKLVNVEIEHSGDGKC